MSSHHLFTIRPRPYTSLTHWMHKSTRTHRAALLHNISWCLPCLVPFFLKPIFVTSGDTNSLVISCCPPWREQSAVWVEQRGENLCMHTCRSLHAYFRVPLCASSNLESLNTAINSSAVVTVPQVTACHWYLLKRRHTMSHKMSSKAEHLCVNNCSVLCDPPSVDLCS